MRNYDIYRGKANDAEALRAMAAASRESSRASFERCDTDGFLSQWANDITAQQFDVQARIAEAGGRSSFIGLYQGERRVAAKRIWTEFNGYPRCAWLLRDDEAAQFGRRFIPAGANSRIQRQLGLTECDESAPAVAFLDGNGTGLSGCANAHVSVKRTGDEWGTDSIKEQGT